MNNYKIKVNDEAESKVAQELFFKLGYTWLSGCTTTSNVNSPYLYTSEDGGLWCGDYHSTFNESGKKELTLPQLRDLVAKSKSKSIEFLEPQDDGTYKLINWTCMSCPPETFIEVPKGAEFYIEMRTELKVGCNFFFMFDDEDLRVFSGSGWLHASYDSIQEYIDEGDELLWSREQAQEQGLISGADAKLAWANGQDVQLRPKTPSETWENLSGKHSLDIFDQVISYEFRLKPRTIKLELEIPAPFEPRDGEEAWCLDGHTIKGYKKIIFNDFDGSGIGFWRTEEEIKAVVAALRGIKE